jgi:hypothetical protein
VTTLEKVHVNFSHVEPVVEDNMKRIKFPFFLYDKINMVGCKNCNFIYLFDTINVRRLMHIMNWKVLLNSAEWFLLDIAAILSPGK